MNSDVESAKYSLSEQVQSPTCAPESIENLSTRDSRDKIHCEDSCLLLLQCFNRALILRRIDKRHKRGPFPYPIELSIVFAGWSHFEEDVRLSEDLVAFDERRACFSIRVVCEFSLMTCAPLDEYAGEWYPGYRPEHFDFPYVVDAPSPFRPGDENAFWFLDFHWSRGLTPLAATLWSADGYCHGTQGAPESLPLPPGRGITCRFAGTHLYGSPIPETDPREIGARANRLASIVSTLVLLASCALSLSKGRPNAAGTCRGPTNAA